ncbi:MAG: PPC domain-containing DNA-binding protein [Anaerolineales bacterium]|jgi:predicted DNA-binding protein with PD1-like motif
MKFGFANPGRIFILRLEDGEILHETVEAFARDQGIRAAALIVLGGADEGSKLVVGPAEARSSPVVPMEHILAGTCESTGVGTIFPGAEGKPVLHMHIACGRKDSTVTGCVRRGVKVWQVMELILWELTGTDAKRVMDSNTGFELLQP